MRTQRTQSASASTHQQIAQRCSERARQTRPQSGHTRPSAAQTAPQGSTPAPAVSGARAQWPETHAHPRNTCTFSLWCVSVTAHRPATTSHSLTVVSAEPEARRRGCAGCQPRHMTCRQAAIPARARADSRSKQAHRGLVAVGLELSLELLFERQLLLALLLALLRARLQRAAQHARGLQHVHYVQVLHGARGARSAGATRPGNTLARTQISMAGSKVPTATKLPVTASSAGAAASAQ